MQGFVRNTLPGRVVFGPGRLAGLPDEARRLHLTRVLVLSTPGQAALAQHASELLGPLSAGVHAKAVMHVPDAVAENAIAAATAAGADGIVAIGGGSTIGLGKAIALQTGLPQIAVPTTYAGSEMTPIWGITRDGLKTTGRDTRVLPATVIYDPELSLALPPRISATSGMNAIAHCVEGLYAADADPLTSLMAEEGIRAFAQSLPHLLQHPDDLEARSRALYGTWLAGSVLGLVGMALHHKLCHTLGGSFGLPHAEVHTVVLPQVAAFNAAAAPEALARVAAALGADSAGAGLYDLAARLGTPLSLRELGMQETDLERAADLATRNPYYNPRPLSRAALLPVLQAAYAGRRPT